MTDNNHPITPPPELIAKWTDNAHLSQPNMGAICHEVATLAARWGADQELEACIQWIQLHFDGMRGWCDDLRAARRPKPPSLKQQALADLAGIPIWGSVSDPENRTLLSALDNIRRALESLPD